MKLSLASQGTTEESTRFEAGLAKQAALFGSGMEKVQTDGSVLRRNVNRWLADNCFSDYYTRIGLNDKEKLYSIVEQCMPYIGYPRTLNAMNIIDEKAAYFSRHSQTWPCKSAFRFRCGISSRTQKPPYLC